jgi:hypothetical protein
MAACKYVMKPDIVSVIRLEETRDLGMVLGDCARAIEEAVTISYVASLSRRRWNRSFIVPDQSHTLLTSASAGAGDRCRYGLCFIHVTGTLSCSETQDHEPGNIFIDNKF